MFWSKKKSELSWQEEARIESAAFKLANIMQDCAYKPLIKGLEKEIALLKKENNELLKSEGV